MIIHKSKYIIVFIALIVLTFCGCANFQLKPTTAKHVPGYLSLGKYQYTVCQLSNVRGVSESDFYYSKLITQLIQNPNMNQVIIVPEQVYNNLLRAKASKLYEYQEVFSKPASELTVREQKEIQALYPQFFIGNFYDTESYIKAQTYYLLSNLDEISLFDTMRYYTELDKERYVVQLQYKYQKQFNKILETDWVIIPCIDASSHILDKKLSEDSPIMISGSGSDTLAEELINSKSKLSKSITPKFVILENTLYSGYVVRNHVMIFLVGGRKTHYQYSGYDTKLVPQSCTVEELNTLNDNNNLFEILNN